MPCCNDGQVRTPDLAKRSLKTEGTVAHLFVSDGSTIESVMHGRSNNEPRLTRGIQEPLITMRRTARPGSEEEDATSLLGMKNVHSHRTTLGQARVASTTTSQSQVA